MSPRALQGLRSVLTKLPHGFPLTTGSKAVPKVTVLCFFLGDFARRVYFGYSAPLSKGLGGLVCRLSLRHSYGAGARARSLFGYFELRTLGFFGSDLFSFAF